MESTNHAEVAYDIWMLVWLSQQLHFTVGKTETLRQQSLHSHSPALKCAPAE